MVRGGKASEREWRKAIFVGRGLCTEVTEIVEAKYPIRTKKIPPLKLPYSKEIKRKSLLSLCIFQMPLDY